MEGELRSSITIVGGGFTGLWTALFLKELDPAIDIILLDQGRVGYGGSGRNAGMLSETIDHSHQLAIVHFGFDEAKKLAQLGRQNIEEMSAFLNSSGIDCNLELTGRLYVALTDGQLEEAERSIEVATNLGVPGMRLLGKKEIQSELSSPLYLGGVFAPGGGILNPVKLVDGLKRTAMNRGVKVFEHTRVLDFSQSRIKTDRGSVASDKIILATDAYTHKLYPKILHRFIPLYDYILVSEPLTQEELASIGWSRRQGVTDGRTFFNYYRLTADNRIVWGTSEAMYYPPNRVEEACDHSPSHYAALHQSFKHHFPQLIDLKFRYAWGGPIASTTRLTPFFGSLESGRVLYGLGYTGHGIGSTRVAGKILAHLALNKKHELLELAMVRKKPFPYPPEPLRSLAVNAVTRSLRRIDAGEEPGLILRILDRMGIGFSS